MLISELICGHILLVPFQSSVLVKKAIDQLFRFMQDLPLYREHFLTMIWNTVMQYKVC